MTIPENLTKEQLISDLMELRRRIVQMEQTEEERRRFHEELLKTKAMFEGLFEFAPDAIVVVDREGRITAANKQAERMFGYSRAELLGAFHDILLPERFRDKHVTDRSNYISAPLIRPMGTGLELYGRKKDGREFPVDIALGPLQAEKDIVVLAVVRDITERKQHEEALRQSEERLMKAMAELARSNSDLEQFAYVVSHDLQAPVRSIRGFSEIMAEDYRGRLGEEADKHLDRIIKGASRVQSMINDILAYSRVGTLAEELTTLDCEAVLSQAIEDLHSSIEESGAVITHGPLPSVKAEQSQMIMLFQNLIGNAIKFSPEEPRVHVNAAKKGNEWVFSVQDNGLGIDPEQTDRIFSPFQRLHTEKEYPGTGIGLAVCKKIVERHGGRIWVESTPGKGSTFYFSLPAGKETEQS
ncbi:MAG: ATP-binding protein [Thermodesulfovibrionales bacterium]